MLVFNSSSIQILQDSVARAIEPKLKRTEPNDRRVTKL